MAQHQGSLFCFFVSGLAMVLNVCQPLLHAKTSGKTRHTHTHKLLQSPQGSLCSGHSGWLSEEKGQPSTHHSSVMEQVRRLIRRTGLSKRLYQLATHYTSSKYLTFQNLLSFIFSDTDSLKFNWVTKKT